MTEEEKEERRIFEENFPIIRLDKKFIEYVIKNNLFFTKLKNRKKNY